jgi:hypothetical protein
MKLPVLLDESIFINPVQLLLCTSSEQWLKTLKVHRLHPTNPDAWVNKGASGTLHTFERDDGATFCVVCIDTKPHHTPGGTVGLIVHEAVHVHQRICEKLGERYPSDEFQAYNIQWLTQVLLKEYTRQVYG